MLQNLTGWHAIIILAVVVLLFGATKLPALAKSVGQSVRILKKEVVEPGPETLPDDEQRVVASAQAADAAPMTRAHPTLSEREAVSERPAA